MDFTPLSLINSLFGFSYTKTPRTQTAQILTGQPQWLSPDSWDAYNIYITTPQLYAVIQRRGYLLASGVWKHYKSDRLGNVIELTDSPVVKLLENPNPLVNGNDHIRQWNENKCVYGNNYEYILRGLPTSFPKGLTNLPAAQMQINVSGKWYAQTTIDGIITGYEYLDGSGVKFNTNEINQTRYVSSKNPVKGESPMTSLFMPISNIRGAYGFRNVIINRKGALGILSNQSKDQSGSIPLTEKERQRLNDEYQRLYGIEEGQMHTIMTNTSLTWQPMTFPTKDLMLFEEINDDFLTIIDAYGLNANIFSRQTGSTYENLAEGIKQAYQSTIIPEAEELAMNRSQLFGLIQKGEWLELDYSHISVLQENEKEKAEVLEKKANAMKTLSELGVYSIDDLKQIINL